MRVLFDTADLAEKLVALLKLEGLEAKNIVWGGAAGEPTAVIEIIALPQQEEPKQTAPDLAASVSALETRVQFLELSISAERTHTINGPAPVVVVDAENDKHTAPTKKRGRPPKQPNTDKTTPKSAHDTLLDKINDQIEEESKTVQSPFGGPAKKAQERRRAQNEYDSFPGD